MFICWPLNDIAIFIPAVSVFPETVTLPTPPITPPLFEQLTFRFVEEPSLSDSSRRQPCWMSFTIVSGKIFASTKHCRFTCFWGPPGVGNDVFERNSHSPGLIFMSAAWAKLNSINVEITPNEIFNDYICAPCSIFVRNEFLFTWVGRKRYYQD